MKQSSRVSIAGSGIRSNQSGARGALSRLEIGALEVFPQFGYEAHLSTGLKTEADTITCRIGMKGSVLGNVSSIFVGHLFDLTYDLETDGGYQRDVRGWTAQYRPLRRNSPSASCIRQKASFNSIGDRTSAFKPPRSRTMATRTSQRKPNMQDLFLRVTFQLRAFAA